MPSLRRTTIFTTLLVFLVVGVVQPPVYADEGPPLEGPRMNWNFEEFRQTFKEDFRKSFRASSGKRPAVGLLEEAAAVSWNLRFQDIEKVKAANIRLMEKYKSKGTLYLEY
jgi:hypothetical protein